MQIFAISPDYQECADYLDIKRKNKMLVESAQMMCTAINLAGGISPYRTTHQNHPDAIWTRTSYANFLWLYNYTLALGRAYNRRTGRNHMTIGKLIDHDILFQAKQLLPDLPQSQFPNCATYHKHIDDVHEAYKQELAYKWQHDVRTPVFEQGEL